MSPWLSGAVLLVWLAAGSGSIAALPHDSIAPAANLYASGDHEAAVAAVRNSVGLTVAEFTIGLERWIDATEPAHRERRRRLAAAFALDAVWNSRRLSPGRVRENYDPHGRVTPSRADRVLVSSLLALGYIPRWSAQQVLANGPVDPFEREFWLAAVGIIEDGSAWHLLETDVLPIARKRLPAEPRLRLSGVLARTNRDLGSLRLTPFFRRSDLLIDDDLPSSVTRRIPAATRAFETLLDDATLAGEAELRIAYLEMRRREWATALSRLDRARSWLIEPVLLAITDYFSGWVHERQRNPEAAIAAYRRAHAVVPTMNNLSARLAALLFLEGERREAYSILDMAFNAPDTPQDLLITLERADARFVKGHLMAIRTALK